MAAVAGWIFVSFPVCQGDIRAVFLFAMALGAIAWEKTIGRLLCPIFATFWLPLEKFFYFINFFAKKFFATAKKWVTIDRLKKQLYAKRKGNAGHGANQEAKNVFNDYLKYAGLEGQGYTLKDTTGTDKNRKFIYEDAEGN